MHHDKPRALQDLRVAEFGEDVAAAYCSKLLADLGAEVYKIERPGGDALRRQEPIDPAGPEPTGGLFHYLNANKFGVRCDLDDSESVQRIVEFVAGADVLVENYGPGRMEGFGLGPDILRSANPRLVYVRISNYGLTGPWRDRVSSNLVLQAETAMSTRLGEQGDVPASIGSSLDQYTGGTNAASATLAAVLRAARTGEGSVVDVPLFETLLYSLSPADVLEEFLTGHGVHMPERQRVTPGFVACADGMVCISVLTGQHWQDLCSIIGQDGWADRMQEIQNDGPDRTEMLEVLSEWSRPLRSTDVMEIMQACRIPVSTATDGKTMLEHPVFRERNFFVPQPGTSFVRPAAPYRLSQTPVTIRRGAPLLAEDEPPSWSARNEPAVDDRHPNPESLPLAGVRVVDLTAFLAGGHVSESLAAYGAKVIKIESPRRPDGYRFVMNFPEFGSEWWEQSPLWQAQNFGKVSLGLDLGTDEGLDVLARLVRSADVLVENMSPRVVEAFGFGYEELRRLNPRIVMVRMPAFGLEGPWRDYVGFAYNIEQVGGMAQNGWEDGPLVQPAGNVDITNAQHSLVATLAALSHQQRTGEGQLVEVSQAETVACLNADQVIEYQLTGHCRKRDGNRAPNAAPQGFYQCKDDRWIAVTVATDDQWHTLCDVIAAPVSLRGLSLRDRRDTHDELDVLISTWTRDRLAEEIADQLHELSVPAGILAQLPELRDNAQLVARRYYLRTSFPGEGDRRRSRLPVLFSFGELPNEPAPRLGQHNTEILEELGFAAGAIDELVHRGIVGAGLQS